MRNIKKYRARVGMSQAECALAIGVSRQIINYAETKKNYCLKEANARKLAELFHCPLYEIVDVKAMLHYLIEEEDKEVIIKQIEEK